MLKFVKVLQYVLKVNTYYIINATRSRHVGAITLATVIHAFQTYALL